MHQTLTLASPDEQKTGPVHWIDHWVITSADIPRWGAFNAQLLGAHTIASPRGIFQQVGPIHIGAFPCEAPLPPADALGHGLPRFGYYVDKADIAAHLARLEALGVPHTQPRRMTDEGETGTAIFWQDPDGNAFEFWAPDAPPAGALHDLSPKGVGRISHAVFPSRDLQRSAAYFERFAELEALRSPDLARDTAVLPLASGGRIVYKLTDRIRGRTAGSEPSAAHTALTVHQDSFFPNYRRVWAELPEWGTDHYARRPGEDMTSLPARRARHPSPEGIKFYAAVGEGDDIYDWDTNKWHFVGGTPHGSMAVYDAHTVGAYMDAWERERGSLDGFRAMATGHQP